MKFVAFFRNVNLGRPRCPSRILLQDAFLQAGAQTAQSFLTNGTLVFSAAPARANAVLRGAISHLQQQCDLSEPAYLRRLDDLAELVRADPFAAVDCDGAYACCITFLHPHGIAQLPALPLTSPRGDVTLLKQRADAVFSLSHSVGRTPGSPNALLEKLQDKPATTRVWNTVVRLVAKHA